MIEIVSATRVGEADFWERTALGASLRRLAYDDRLLPRIAYANRRGLPEIYNARITAAAGTDVLAFIHDDVWIDDFHLADRVVEGLRTYDVIGVAGNRRRVPRQPAWGFMDAARTWDDRANLSGAIAHAMHPFGRVSFYGTPGDCELLDGVFLAARKSTLVAHRVAFDPRFDFHFYDMDFARSARSRGLRLGTWPICLTHQSKGDCSGASWEHNHRIYVEKWKD
jgi:glycosyltransferase involved in cell wall biosynthesis